MEVVRGAEVTVVQRLSALVEAASANGASPIRLVDLGSEAELGLATDEVAGHHYAPAYAQALLATSEPHDTLTSAFVAAMTKQRSVAVLSETCEILFANQAVVQQHGPSLAAALLPNVDAKDDNPHLAALSVEALLRLVLLDSVPSWQLMPILSTPAQAPDEYLDRLPRLISIAMDRLPPGPDRKALRATLQALAERDSTDAVYEFGKQTLREALETATADDALPIVTEAISLLAHASHDEEARDDAVGLRAACEALQAFLTYNPSLLREAAAKARDAADLMALNRLGMHDHVWTDGHRAAQYTLMSVAWRLDEAARHTSGLAFVHTEEAIACLGSFYSDHGAVSPSGYDVGPLVRPHLENQIAVQAAMLQQLERAVATDDRLTMPQLPVVARELLQAARAAATRQGSTGSTKEPHPSSALSALLSPEGAERFLRETSDPDAANRLATSVLRSSQLRTPAVVDSTRDQLESALLTELADNPSFVDVARQHFAILTQVTVAFVRDSLDVNHGYQRPWTTGTPAPQEQAIHDHFATFLQSSVLGGRVRVEIRNVATGRADVHITMDDGVIIVVEVKRETSNASRENLEKQYLGQALAYSGTSIPFSGLLVLDLTGHNPMPSLSDAMWVRHHTPPGALTQRSVLCAVVTGKRPPPSSVKI